MTPSKWKSKKKTPDNNLAKISNSLIEAFVKKNNLGALKILFYISKTKISVNDSELTSIILNTKELTSYCDINIATLRRNIEQMQETSISFIEDDSYEENITVIPYTKFVYGGHIEVKMFDKVLNLIAEVQNRFTIIDVENLMKLKSKHSVRMIQLLEMIESFSTFVAKRKTYTLEELNGMFGTNYPRLKEFERKILIPVKEELDQVSDLTYLYQLNFDKEDITKAGRPKAVSIVLDLVSNRKRQLKMF